MGIDTKHGGVGVRSDGVMGDGELGAVDDGAGTLTQNTTWHKEPKIDPKPYPHLIYFA